jgi:hypothetical protein
MAKRRGRGEGSITQRADGRWMARVDLGWEDGKRRYKAVYGPTRRAVAGKLTKVLREVQQGAALPDERQTVAQFLERWFGAQARQPPVARVAHVRTGSAAAPGARHRQGAALPTHANAGRSLVPYAPGGRCER